MRSFFHKIGVIRPINLLVIAFTFLSIRDYMYYFNFIELTDFQAIHYWNFCIASIIIAASGNIINDYFDVKADRINKPNKLYITKYIKPRWAIVLNWSLNTCGIGIGIYISASTNNWFYLILLFITTLLLTIYSFQLKKTLLLGNFTIALLTTALPFSAFYFFIDQSHFKLFQFIGLNPFVTFPLLQLFFAFCFNFIREIIKDIQDVEGDQFIHARTLPIKIGIPKSIFIVRIFIAISTLTGSILLFLSGLNLSFSLPYLFGLIYLVFLLFSLNSTQHIKLHSFLLKLIMFIGLITPYYWLCLK